MKAINTLTTSAFCSPPSEQVWNESASSALPSKSLSSPDFFQLSCLSRREKSSVCTKLSVLAASQRLGRREREMCQKSWVVLVCFVTSHLECSSQHQAGLWDTLWAASSRRQNHDFLLNRRQRQGKEVWAVNMGSASVLGIPGIQHPWDNPQALRASFWPKKQHKGRVKGFKDVSSTSFSGLI